MKPSIESMRALRTMLKELIDQKTEAIKQLTEVNHQ